MRLDGAGGVKGAGDRIRRIHGPVAGPGRAGRRGRGVRLIGRIPEHWTNRAGRPFPPCPSRCAAPVSLSGGPSYSQPPASYSRPLRRCQLFSACALAIGKAMGRTHHFRAVDLHDRPAARSGASSIWSLKASTKRTWQQHKRVTRHSINNCVSRARERKGFTCRNTWYYNKYSK
jgi:hypothetical protein